MDSLFLHSGERLRCAYNYVWRGLSCKNEFGRVEFLEMLMEF